VSTIPLYGHSLFVSTKAIIFDYSHFVHTARTGRLPLDRILVKSYSDGTTPQANFQYDAGSDWGNTLSNTVGRLSEEWTSTTTSDPTATIFSYDPMGRIQWEVVCTPVYCPNTTGNRYGLSYRYDLIGDMTYSTNGAEIAFTSTYNSAARLTTLTSSLSDSNHPGTLLSNAQYIADGSLGSVTLGNGISETRTYDSRLRPTGISDPSVYTLTIPSGGYASNSDVLAANDSVNGNWTYAYDPFNRLIGSSKNSGANAYSYVYDRYGNRWQQNVTAGSGPAPSYGFDANNHLVAGSGVTYDGAGDTTDDGTTSYTYDAEGRVATATNTANGTSSYIYDAEGRRAEKTTAAGGTVDFLYDLEGHEISQMSPVPVWTRGEVYADGRHIATYSGGTTYFIHSDWLGSERARSAVNGTSAETCTSLPFGDWLTCAGSDVSPMHFTGKQRDSESGLDNFGARYNSSSMGRFMSPDPDNISGVLHMDDDPQSWNAYSYVRNNPLNLTDPTGTVFCSAAGAGDPEGVTQVCDVTDADYVNSSKEQQAAYDKAGYTHFDCSCDTGADKDAWQNRNGNVSTDWIGNGLVFGAVFAGLEGLFYPQLHPSRTPTPSPQPEPVNLTDQKATTHTLDGDATGGGHAPGTGIPGKSEFPAGWSRDRIMDAISDVATDPASKTTTAGRTTLVDGTRDGVNIRVVIRDNRIVTGYPTNLPRNP
jgi:RHS repeat-associated protein